MTLSTNQFFESVQARAYSKYPSLKEKGVFFKPDFFSPYVVDVRRDHLTQMQELISRAFHFEKPGQGPYSLLMGYDFHITSEGPRLIEINTNAAGALLVDLLTDNAGLIREKSFAEFFMEDLLDEFHSISPGHSPMAFAVVDDNLEAQGFFSEMLMYRDLVHERLKIPALVAEAKSFLWSPGEGLYSDTQQVDLVYFRSTDFELQSPSCEALRHAYESKTVLISPNPAEYRRLAHKERLFELAAHLKIDSPIRMSEDLWPKRKELVFKPMNKFASRGVYRGSSISRAKFLEIASDASYMAQTYYPPQVVSFGEQSYKCDIRCYVYQDTIELLAARLYQGQVTSFGAPGGGMAAVRIVD